MKQEHINKAVQLIRIGANDQLVKHIGDILIEQNRTNLYAVNAALESIEFSANIDFPSGLENSVNAYISKNKKGDL
jgi:hypothetical protein